MSETVQFSGIEVAPSASIRVVGLHIDSKLRRGPHIAQIKARATTQSRALKCLTGLTWGATFTRRKTFHNAVVRPILTFAAPIWHYPKGTAGAVETHTRTLGVIQNDCLRSVLGAYKATPVPVLEAEAATPPILIQLDNLVMKYQALRGTHASTIAGNKKIRRRSKGKRGRARRQALTPTQEKEKWALRELGATSWDQAATGTRRKAHWHDPARDTEEFQDTNNILMKVKDWKQLRWEERWEAYQATIPEESQAPAVKGPLLGDCTDHHQGLRKAESSLATQLRSGKNCFKAFLLKANVPGIQDSRCGCGWAKQDAKHILLFCPELRESRLDLIRDAGTHDFRKMLTEPRGIRAAARWLIKTGCLEQFRLAKLQLERTKLPREAVLPPKSIKALKTKRKGRKAAEELRECCRPDALNDVILVEGLARLPRK